MIDDVKPEHQEAAALIERLVASGYSIEFAPEANGIRIYPPEGTPGAIEADNIRRHAQAIAEIVQERAQDHREQRRLVTNGLIPWTVEGIADAFEYIGTLSKTPQDDWPNLQGPFTTYEVNRFDFQSQLASYLVEKYGHVVVGLAHASRCIAITAFLRKHKRRLLRDGWIVENRDGETIDARLQQALAELPYHREKIRLQDALARAKEKPGEMQRECGEGPTA